MHADRETSEMASIDVGVRMGLTLVIGVGVSKTDAGHPCVMLMGVRRLCRCTARGALSTASPRAPHPYCNRLISVRGFQYDCETDTLAVSLEE